MFSFEVLFFLVCIIYVTAFPEGNLGYDPSDPVKVLRPSLKPTNPLPVFHPTYNPTFPPKFIRVRRFTDDSTRFDGQNPQEQPKPNWEVKPDLSRDNRGNTNARIEIQNHGKNHDFEADYEQTIRGPDKHSEAWHVGTGFKW